MIETNKIDAFLAKLDEKAAEQPEIKADFSPELAEVKKEIGSLKTQISQLLTAISQREQPFSPNSAQNGAGFGQLKDLIGALSTLQGYNNQVITSYQALRSGIQEDILSRLPESEGEEESPEDALLGRVLDKAFNDSQARNTATPSAMPIAANSAPENTNSEEKKMNLTYEQLEANLDKLPEIYKALIKNGGLKSWQFKQEAAGLLKKYGISAQDVDLEKLYNKIKDGEV